MLVKPTKPETAIRRADGGLLTSLRRTLEEQCERKGKGKNYGSLLRDLSDEKPDDPWPLLAWPCGNSSATTATAPTSTTNDVEIAVVIVTAVVFLLCIVLILKRMNSCLLVAITSAL